MDTTMTLPRLLTARDLAQLLGISEWMVYDWSAKGMPTVRVGRARRWDPLAVRAWLANGGTPDEAA